MSDAMDRWKAPQLDAGERRLVDAFLTIGRRIEDLPYTEDFEKLRRLVNVEDTPEARHLLFKQLLRLRSMGQLPGLGTTFSSSSSSSSAW